MGHPVGQAEMERYQEDGVTVLRGCIDAEWVNKLRVAVEKDLVSQGRAPKSTLNLRIRVASLTIFICIAVFRSFATMR